MIFGQDDEEFWASIPIIGPARQQVISTYEDVDDAVANIPDDLWNGIPILGPVRKAILFAEAATSIPAWVWLAVPISIGAVLVLRVVTK